MKTLIIARHGKSDWNVANAHDTADFDRPLNERGRGDATTVARELAAQGLIPEKVIASSAKRTTETAERLISCWDADALALELTEDLYLAGYTTLLRSIQGLDESLNTVLLCGHNPGVHELLIQLDHRCHIEEFPTLAVAVLTFPEVEFWGNVDQRKGKVQSFFVPRELAQSA